MTSAPARILPLPQHVSIARAAELLSVSPDTIYREIRRGRLAAARVARRIVVPCDAIQSYLAKSVIDVPAIVSTSEGHTSTRTVTASGPRTFQALASDRSGRATMPRPTNDFARSLTVEELLAKRRPGRRKQR